jgi:hypothetical protein
MSPVLRKLTLTAHVTVSVGWLGAAVAYLALAVTALRTTDVAEARASFQVLQTVAWFAILPLCLAASATGLLQALATEWGLVRHRWIIVKAVLTAIGTAILLGHIPAIDRMSAVATNGESLDAVGHLPTQLVVHATGGVILLVAIATISVFKPWGKTRFARRGES